MRNSRKSYQEYDPEKVEKKSKEFLKMVLGKEKFDILQKDGKIEIEVDNKSNEKIVYELYSDGRVINKTKNQSYCIVTDRSDYPIDDLIAIKYSWLVHKNDIVEKVTNKTHLYTGIVERANRGQVSPVYIDFVREMESRGWTRQTTSIQYSGHPGYADYVDYLSGLDWRRELIAIDEHNITLSETRSLNKGNTGCIINIVCPAGSKLSIMGTQQLPSGADTRIAYSLCLYVTDENGEEIPDDTRIRITKERPCDIVVQLARIFYSDIRLNDKEHIYKFRQGIEMNGQEHFMVYIIDSQNNIPAENVKFKIEADYWIDQ